MRKPPNGRDPRAFAAQSLRTRRIKLVYYMRTTGGVMGVRQKEKERMRGIAIFFSRKRIEMYALKRINSSPIGRKLTFATLVAAIIYNAQLYG